jgi:hypothetical protein
MIFLLSFSIVGLIILIGYKRRKDTFYSYKDTSYESTSQAQEENLLKDGYCFRCKSYHPADQKCLMPRR